MTAIALLLLLIAGAAGYVSWADHRIAHGDPAWWFVAGAPLAYLLPVLLLASRLVHAELDLAHAAAA